MASKINLHIGNLIGKLVVINIPSGHDKNSDQYSEYSFEHVRSVLESALLRAVSEIDIDKEISQKDSQSSNPQKKSHQ